MTYYNTTSLTHSDLQTATGQAKHQDERILNFLKEHPNELFTPFEIHDRLFTSSTPVDSVKRSLNTLTKGLFAVKTKTMRMGKYGRPNHTWKLLVVNNQPTLF